MSCDPWFYRQRLDASRLRMAALSVQLAAPAGSQVIVDARGVVVVGVPEPWWSGATLGLWTLYTMRKVVKRCRAQVPEINGFCPTVEVRGCRRSVR